MKRTLVIDGNFMCKRMLRDYTFKDSPEQDRIGYLTDLANHISCEIERVEGFCDNIIMVKDSHSWRKSVSIKPNLKLSETGEVYTSTQESENYKANRVQSDDRDWRLIFATFVEFCECLRDHFDVAFIDVPGAEGDDCIWGVTKFLRSQKIKTCVYCTDSDISQLVTSSNVILRRIKSKAAPDGEIVVDQKFWDLYSKEADSTDPMAIFNYNPVKWAADQDMFKGKSLNQGIVICHQPFKILKMMLMGSIKDNVPEIFTWRRKTQFRHITEKFIEDALLLTGKLKTDVTYQDLYSEPFLRSLIINLCHITGQYSFVRYLDYLYELVEQNRHLNFLSEKEIPSEVQNAIFSSIEAQWQMKANFKELKKVSNIVDYLHVSKDKIYQQLGI